uniref:Uncharacterized protein n=1 Tax=Leersia perrieri TaxID=77586 RepID=A0A0D9WYD7_9ORYZ
MTKKPITPQADALPLAKHFACSQAMPRNDISAPAPNASRSGRNIEYADAMSSPIFSAAAPTAKSYMANLPRLPIKKTATKRKALASAPISTSKAESQNKKKRMALMPDPSPDSEDIEQDIDAAAATIDDQPQSPTQSGNTLIVKTSSHQINSENDFGFNIHEFVTDETEEVISKPQAISDEILEKLNDIANRLKTRKI